jgi:hypothetical protein
VRRVPFPEFNSAGITRAFTNSFYYNPCRSAADIAWAKEQVTPQVLLLYLAIVSVLLQL